MKVDKGEKQYTNIKTNRQLSAYAQGKFVRSTVI